MEWILIHRYNHFVQEKGGRILKDTVEDKQDDDKDSVIICEVGGQKLPDELYHEFLDNYTETILKRFHNSHGCSGRSDSEKAQLPCALEYFISAESGKTSPK